MQYILPISTVATAAVAGTFKTLGAIIVPDTTNLRVRLTDFHLGPATAAPTDVAIEVKVALIADVSAGTAGTKTAITAANIPPVDVGAPACRSSGGIHYTVEPTTYNTYPLWHGGFNHRGVLNWYWLEENRRPVAGQDMLIGILAAPQTAAAVELIGTIGFEEY
jgi:hypothetical protein